MLILPELRGAAASVGRWRYFLTGLPLAVLLGMIVRALGKLAEPFGMWMRFSGICETVTETDGQYTLCVRFQDRRRLTHTAAFRTAHPSAANIRAGEQVSFAVRTELFTAGSYAQTADAAHENDGGFLLRAAHRTWLLRTIGAVLLRELLLCTAALVVFLLAVYLCFPA